MAEEKIPTATVTDRVGEYLYPDEDRATLVFLDSNGKKFALTFETKVLALLNKMVGRLIFEFHEKKPETKIFRPSYVATVVSLDDIRGQVLVQFDGDIAYAIPDEVGLELSEILQKVIETHMSEADRIKYARKRKSPKVYTPPPPKIIRP